MVAYCPNWNAVTLQEIDNLLSPSGSKARQQWQAPAGVEMGIASPGHAAM